MRQTLHRSENLHIYREPTGSEVYAEIRFSASLTRGTCDGTCPRCGKLGKPAFWELEGPDGNQNTLWMNCDPSGCEEEFTWSRTVRFEEWVDSE